VHVADYYYRRGAYLAAANRAQASLLSYPQTAANEDALIVMAKSYDRLGLIQLRDDAQRVLKETFPNGKYFTASVTPWWQFWTPKDEPPPPAAAAPASAKPWWQFW
jgi:outer membrane protein assembly factor BamD